GVRHRVRHHRRSLRHGRGRQPDVLGADPVPKSGTGLCVGRHPPGGRDPDHGGQRPQPASAGDLVVNTVVGSRKSAIEDPPQGSGTNGSPPEAVGTSWWSRAWVRAAVVLIAVFWSLPTAGLLISSFRSRGDSDSTGWWTALLHPFETTWTLANYTDVLSANGMFDAFV